MAQEGRDGEMERWRRAEVEEHNDVSISVGPRLCEQVFLTRLLTVSLCTYVIVPMQKTHQSHINSFY